MTTRPTSLLRAMILTAIATPAIHCGGETTDETGTTSQGGGGGAGGQGGTNTAGTSSQAGKGGSGQAGSGTAGTSNAGQGGTGTAGTGTAGSGTAGSGTAGTGTAGTGTAGTGTAGSGTAGTAQGGSAGAQGGSGGTGGSGQGGSAGTGKVPCDNPTPVLVGGKPTGYEVCDNGALHRRVVLECPVQPADNEVCPAADQGGDCKVDADCTGGQNGRCVPYGNEAIPGCVCRYGCVTDADCGAGSICVCADPVGYCVMSTCTSDKDCPQGGCAAYERDPGCGFQAFACQLLKDECASNEECAAKDPSKPFCSLDQATQSYRVCTGPGCAIGRPLMVAERLRHAGLAVRLDWAA